MRIQALHHVPPSVDRAVVINVGTEVVTTLAIASALRNLDMPLLVVNCTATGASKRLMDTLSEQWNFDLIDLPTNLHGVMLDRIFEEVNADRITLVDSDAEVKNAGIVKPMIAAFDNPSVYGAGALHEATWLTDESSVLRIDGHAAPVLYAERPWIPFVMFRSSYVRSAVANGASFRELFGVGAGDNGLIVPPGILRQRSSIMIHGDTGAEIHSWLVKLGYRFDGTCFVIGDDVAHLHGVTRIAMLEGSGNGTPLDAIEQEVLERLRNLYADMWPGFAAAVKAAQTSAPLNGGSFFGLA